MQSVPKQMYTIVGVRYYDYDPTERNTVAASLDISTLQQAVDYYKANESLIKNTYREYITKSSEFHRKEVLRHDLYKMDRENQLIVCKQLQDHISEIFAKHCNFIENEIIYNILRDWGLFGDLEIETTPLY